MSKGFIKIDRSLLDSDIWINTGEKFTKGQAWVDLIMLAEYEDNSYKGYTRHRGEVHRSQRWLAKRWGWSTDKVSRFLKELERDRMCDTKRHTNGTVITLAKYRFFQGGRDTNKDTHKDTSKGQLRNIKNNSIKTASKSAVSDSWELGVWYDD